jgi:hypothetical protein
MHVKEAYAVAFSQWPVYALVSLFRMHVDVEAPMAWSNRRVRGNHHCWFIVLRSAHDGTSRTLRHLNRISPVAIGVRRVSGSNLSNSRLSPISHQQRQTSTAIRANRETDHCPRVALLG